MSLNSRVHLPCGPAKTDAPGSVSSRSFSCGDLIMTRQIISTTDAPAAIGTYSQAVRVGPTVYISGQVPLDPATGQLVSGDIEMEIRRVFDNLEAIAKAAGGSLRHAVRVTVFLTDLVHFAKVNEVMAQYIPQPWPARAALGVSQLPKGARVEIDCILHLD
jgi:reactive intermediate/imine deaminase